MAVRTCSIEEVRRRVEQGDCRLVDVREFPEYVEGHVAGSLLLPLTELQAGAAPDLTGDVLLLCRSGRRARQAADLLAQRGVTPVVVEGGIEAWKQAGYPLRRERGPISLERQVRIAAGTLVLTGILLDLVVPGARYLSAFVGAGLIFAGVTDTCAMGLLIARLPWNRAKNGVGSASPGILGLEAKK